MIGYHASMSPLSHQIHDDNAGNKGINTPFITLFMKTDL